MNSSKHIVIGITGASGSIYAKSLIEKLQTLNTNIKLSIIISDTGRLVMEKETKSSFLDDINLPIFNNSNFNVSFASGSSVADAMVVVPCSHGTLGRIANGSSDNLICRSADVILKERKKLILVTRETPLNLIHIKNMETLTLAGGIILPASPSFYLMPKTIEDLINTITFRIIDLLGIDLETQRWDPKEY